MEWYMQAMQKYATFNGRARRKEYWMFLLFNTLLMCAVIAAAGALGSFFNSGYTLAYAAYALYALGTMIPALSAMVRRLHDVGRSGWWYFIILVPIVGAFVLLYWLCSEGTAGSNQYGANPKLAESNGYAFGD